MKRASPRSKPAVLVVDDVEANLIALEAQLEDLDCEVVRARSGNEALALLLKRDYAVMLLDVQMPGMDGFEVARLAHGNATTRSVPILFVTAMTQTADTLFQAYDTGAVDYLFKPVDRHVLRAKVRVFLDLYRGHQRLADEIAAHKRTLADLESFNYSVSHDLRAPLRHLDGYSSALMEDFGASLEPEARKHLERISAAAKRMSQLIDDLLRLSQISRADVRFVRTDLAALSRSVHDYLQNSEPTREVELLLGPECFVDCDPDLLRIAFENLLRNARKFSSKKPKCTIEIGERELQGKRVFFVKDNGAGFDPASAKKLFRPFQRLHAAAEFEGTGIGLAIVARVVRHHGGDIWAEGAVGEGATFFFTLPG